MKRMGQLFLEDYRHMKKLQKLRDRCAKVSILKFYFNYLIELKRRKFVKTYGCEVSPGATIGNCYFLHPIGLVIGRDAIIEDGVIIMSGITFGSLKADGAIGKQHVKTGTLIGTGAKILGDLTIGENCVIGANSVVTKDVPNNSLVVGYNIIKEKKNKEYIKLDVFEDAYAK